MFFLTSVEVDLLFKAVTFAEKMHEGITRVGGEPYINHLLRVDIAVAEYFEKNDRQNAMVAIISAILHDVVEDTEATIEEVECLFGSEAAHIVASLSHAANPDGSVNDEEPDEIYFARVKSGGLIAIKIKRYDVLDNIASLANAPEDFRKEKTAGHKLRMHLWEAMDSESAFLIQQALEKI